MKPNYTQNAIPVKLDLFFIITGPRLVKYAVLFYLTSFVYTTFDDNSVSDKNRFGGNDEKVVVQNRQLFGRLHYSSTRRKSYGKFVYIVITRARRSIMTTIRVFGITSRIHTYTNTRH